MSDNTPVFFLNNSESTIQDYAQELLAVHPELDVLAVWNPEIDGLYLKGSAPGIPVNAQELLAQLCLGNIFRYSAMVMRLSITDKSHPAAGAEKLDEHQLWFSLVRKNRLGFIVISSSQHFGDVDENRSVSSRRIEFIRQYCIDDLNAIDVIERALSLDPNDISLSEFYFAYLQDIKQRNLVPEHWETAQYLRCMKIEGEKVQALNDLAEYYQRIERPYLSALTHLYSLAQAPNQPNIFRMFSKAWFDGQFEPIKPKLDQNDQTMVSVLLCTYNRPESLRQALDSVLSQTYEDYEVLVINDGGDRIVKNVVEQLNSEKVRYFYREHGGHRAALNFGLQMARGKYIAYLDDDDIYYPNHLDALVHAAEANCLDFVCSRNRWVQGHWDADQWMEDYELTRRDNGFQVERMRISAYVPDNTVLHRRSIAEKIGLFWEEPQRGGEWEYWVRCSRFYKIQRIESVTCECRVLTASLPLTQPARARLFSELWRAYFGSEFGYAILALGAYYVGDHDVWHMALKHLAEQYVYLYPDVYDRLWKICIQDGSLDSQNLLVKMARYDMVTFSQKLLKYNHLVAENLPHITLKVFLFILKYIIFHPLYTLHRLAQLMTE